ncbi:MAG: hypothetical protein FWH17_00430 [Oscillospiraceae bacterium]|nr:hypothetical protein [Oscillospiraceae bacterium]
MGMAAVTLTSTNTQSVEYLANEQDNNAKPQTNVNTSGLSEQTFWIGSNDSYQPCASEDALFATYTKTGSIENEYTDVNIFNEELYRQYTKPGVDVFVSSANHSPPVLLNGDKRHPEIARIIEYTNEAIRDYITGKADSATVANAIENMYRDLLAYNVSLGKTDGTDPHYNARLLYDVQGNFSRLSVVGNWLLNQADGDAYAHANYSLNQGDRYIYYDAKYYYANLKLQEIGKAAIAGIAEEKGFSSFNVQGFYTNPHRVLYYFNDMWQHQAINTGITQMKNTDAAPPKDFVMFFTPRRFSQDAWENGTTYMITANDPGRSDGHGGHDFFIKVPKGKSLFKEEPLWMTRFSATNADGVSHTGYDITKHLRFMSGDDYMSNLKSFFAKYVNNFDNGELVIWSGGTKSTHDVPLGEYFDEKRMYLGNELTAAFEYNNFIGNFEFRYN